MSEDIPVAKDLDEANAIIAALARDNRQLSEQVALLMHRAFGRKTEKLDPNQLPLFEEAGESAVEAEATASAAASSPKKKTKGHGRASFPASLPRVDERHVLPEDCRCDVCDSPMRALVDEVSERGHVVPAQIIVKRICREKRACPKGCMVKTAAAPAPLIDRCKYEPSVYASIAVSKYADHLPLHRQEAMWKRQGMPIAKSTMADMVQRVAEIAGDPIVKQMEREVLEDGVVHADETPITVLLEGKKGQAGRKTGYVWIYKAGIKSVFVFRQGRGRDGPCEFLRGYKGLMVTDGYAGYDEVERREELTRIGCWAHARRKFKEALDAKDQRAGPILRLISWLYRLESMIARTSEERWLSDPERRALALRVRERLSRRVTERIEAALLDLEARADVLPKQQLGKAVRYALGQWNRLTRFLKHPEAPLDNNAAERDLRQVALGRKNWLFAGSPKGAETAATLYSLMASCKAIGVDPFAYLADVLERVATTPASEIRTLTPWAWAAQQ